jgi:hypothetical protein
VTPEDLLRQTSQASRTAHQQKQTQQQKIRSRRNPHAVALPYDGDRGSQQIQLSDGSIQEAQTNSNGVIGDGDTVALHQGKGRSRINVMPHQPRRQQQPPPKAAPTEAIFWNLNSDRLYEIRVKNNQAIASLVTRASNFPSPYNSFHRSEPGLARISQNEFYIPNFTTINRLNISTNTGVSPVTGLNYVYCSCSLNGYAFFAIRETGGGPTKILRINPDGSTDRSAVFSSLNVWSIAAITPDLVYFVEDYTVVGLYSLATGDRTDLFSTVGYGGTTLSGGAIDGFEVRDIQYAFAGASNTCYVVGTIKDSQIDGLPLSHIATNLTVAGDIPAEEVAIFPAGTKIISGNFSSYTIPGDSGVVSLDDSTTSGRLEVYRVLDDNTIYGYRDAGFGDWGGDVSAAFNISDRHRRTTIWKIQGSSVTTYFKFPGVDSRETVSGYRYFFNLPCRAGIYDSKTQSIFMVGFINKVVVDGRFIGDLAQPSDNLLVQISKAKQFKAMPITPGPNTPSDFGNAWEWFSQLEPIR